jgi:ABC-type bacteriocin/lantibiotic exporter with double-glycine peptidase domain
MVFFTTAFEVYFLNPKIVSSYFKLPISIIFIILMISEKFFWILWLLIWVSLFYFIIWLMMDFEKSLNKKNIKIITKKNKKND